MISKIVVNNLELTPNNGYYLQSMKDIGYATKYPTATTMNTHGIKIGKAYLKNKSFGFDYKVGASSPTQLLERRNAIYSALTIKEDGSDEDFITVYIYLANGAILEAYVVVDSVDPSMGLDDFVTCNVSFMVTTEKPFFQSRQQYQYDIFITKGGGWAVPFGIPLDMSAGAGTYKQLNNGGNTFTYPDIYFYGELTNPILRNITTGKTISLSATLADNTKWYKIDTWNRIVTDQDGNNKRDKMTGSFLTLQPGENLFDLTSDNASEGGKVVLVYQYNYISI